MKICKYITAKAAFFIISVILSMTVLYFKNAEYGIQWKDIFVEANGMVFDLILLGVLLTFFEAWREKIDKIERLKEEIIAYRNWNEKQATYKIVYAIKELNRLKAKQIDLCSSFLKEANLVEANLSNSWLHDAILIGADLKLANLVGARLVRTNLSDADLHCAIVGDSNWFDKLEEWQVIGREEIKQKYLIADGRLIKI